jgi:predicted PurR-regulated permease PerM
MSSGHIKVSNAFQLGLLGGLGVLTAILIGNMLVTIAGVITYVFAAIFIALGLDPVISWLEHKGLKRPLAITAVALVVVTAVTLITVSFLPALLAQAAKFIESAPAIIDGFQKLPWLVALDAKFGGAIYTTLSSAGAFISNSANWPTMLGGVVQVGLSIVNGITGGIVIVILSLYFTASLKSFKRFIYAMVPGSKREKFVNISEQVAQAVGRYVLGQVSIAAINAILGFIFMLIVGVPYAGVLATISFVLALIPLVGALSAATVVTVVSLSVSPQLALISLIYYLIYMQIEAYVISPRIMNKAVAVPGAVVVVAALAGGTLLGVLGALVAIPVAASGILVLRQVWLPHQEKR